MVQATAIGGRISCMCAQQGMPLFVFVAVSGALALNLDGHAPFRDSLGGRASFDLL